MTPSRICRSVTQALNFDNAGLLSSMTKSCHVEGWKSIEREPLYVFIIIGENRSIHIAGAALTRRIQSNQRLVYRSCLKNIYPPVHLLHLLRLPGLGALPPLPGRLGPGLGVEEVVPPAEAAGVVADEALVVHVVVLSAGPEGEEVVQAPGELVAGVGVDGLKQTAHDPQVHGQDVQVLGEGAPDDGAEDGAEAQEHDLDRRGVLGRQAEGGRVLVVDLVHVAVEGPPVEHAVRPVVPAVLEDEEHADLHRDLPQRREGHAGPHAEEDGHRVEEPDLRQLDGEVREEDEPGAVPLLGGGGDFLLTVLECAQCVCVAFPYILNLVPVEPGYSVDYDPRQTAAKVDSFMHHLRSVSLCASRTIDSAHKGQDSRGENIVLHPGIPCRPQSLQDVQVNVGLRDQVVVAPVRLGWRRQRMNERNVVRPAKG